MASINVVTEFLARLMTRTPWGKIETAKLQGLVENIDQVIPEFVRFIENGGKVEMVAPVIATWKTIKIGVHRTLEAFEKALAAAGFKSGEYAVQILKKVVWAEVEQEIELVRVTVGQLGFPKGATRAEIYERATLYGLTLCPAEVGPALRLAYKDQPKGEWLLIAMEPIAGSVGSLRVFDVVHDDDGVWLDTSSGHPGFRWYAGDEWVFARRNL